MAARKTPEEKERALEMRIRHRTFHGWAFQDWTADEEAAIKAFLALETDEVPAGKGSTYDLVTRQLRRVPREPRT